MLLIVFVFLTAAKSDKCLNLEEIFKLPKTQFNPPFLCFAHHQCLEISVTRSRKILGSSAPGRRLKWRWGAIAQQEAVATDFLRLGAGMSGAGAQANWADPFLCRFCGKICFGEYLTWILFYFIR